VNNMRCIFCGYTNSPSGFGGHACKKAPERADAPRFQTTGSRPLTLDELQDCRIESGLPLSPRIARELRKATPRGVCVGCGCTAEKACVTYAGPCSWTDREHTVCSACFSPIGYSGIEENLRSIRAESRVPLLRRAREILYVQPNSKVRVKAISVRLRKLGKRKEAA